MAPHTVESNHPGGGVHLLLPKPQSPLSVTKNMNAGKPPPASSGTIPRGRDLQSAMQHAPTIRVIHIFAPKVIKTDVANFRSTVQKLTGRGKTKSQRRAARNAATAAANNNNSNTTLHGGDGNSELVANNSEGILHNNMHPLFWDQSEKEVLTLQRMVVDACGTSTADHLVRCDSVDSATYSLDSGHTFSGDSTGAVVTTTTSTSPDHPSFSFYPQRETPYSLSEIPAPFFGGHVDMHMSSFGQPMSSSSSQMLSSSGSSLFGVPGNHHHHHHNNSSVLMGLPTSHLIMDPSSSSCLPGLFDVDAVTGLPTLSDVAPLGCNISSSGGSLFDLMPRQHCRLSVQSPYQGANFFEPI